MRRAWDVRGAEANGTGETLVAPGRAASCLTFRPFFEPTFQRRLTFAGRLAGQEIVHADVFIQVRPVDPASVADQSPVTALVGRAVRQTRIPNDGRGNLATVGQIDEHRLVVDLNACGRWNLGFSRGRIHYGDAADLVCFRRSASKLVSRSICHIRNNLFYRRPRTKVIIFRKFQGVILFITSLAHRLVNVYQVDDAAVMYQNVARSLYFSNLPNLILSWDSQLCDLFKVRRFC